MESLNLTPAESLMIISPDSNGNEMIKLTLMDLLLKKALEVKVNDHESKFLKRSNISEIIIKNDSSKLTFKPHEELLMEIVNNNELELNVFAKTLYNRIKSSDYKNIYIRMPLIDEGYFKIQRKMLLALVPYNNYVLTEKGLEIKSKIMELLDEAEYLEEWMKEDLGRAKAYLSVIGAHILLTKIYDMEDIKKFNRMLSYIKPEAKTSDYYNYYLYKVTDEHMDDFGDLKSFDFLDVSLLDNFESLDYFFSDFDAESLDDGSRRDSRVFATKKI
jgi:hypothetical protein